MTDRIDDYAMLAVAGPARAGDRAGDLRLAAARADDAPRRSGWPAPRRWSAAPATPARTASSCCARPEDAPALWDELVAPRRRARRASAARDTLRLEVCFHLYGNDLTRRARPDRSGARLVLQGGHRLHRRGGRARGARGGPRGEARRVRDRRPRDRRARATRCVGGGEVTSGTLSPCLGVGIGMAYVPAERAAVGTAPRDRRSWQDAPRRRQGEAALPKGHVNGRGQLPRRPALPPRARLGAHRPGRPSAATLGITWYAQDALGEVVFFEPPGRRHDARQGRALRRGRVGQGRLRRDRAAVGRDRRGQRGARRRPRRRSTRTPTARAGSCKVRLADPAERDALLDAARLHRATPGRLG